MGYEALFDYHVMPIVRARHLDNETFNGAQGQWVGTGFTFGEGTFVTCWHCVGAALAEDEVYLALGRERGNHQRSRDWPIELRELARDVNGTDLALARIEPQFEPRLRLAMVPLQWGEDVIALGFPHTLSTVNPETGTRIIDTHARVLKGYVTRNFRDPYQDDELVVELSITAPVGMSGGPLFNAPPSIVRGGPALEALECCGVVYGEHSVHTEDHVHHYGTAFRLDTLRNAAGPATNQLPLAEYLERRGNPEAKQVL